MKRPALRAACAASLALLALAACGKKPEFPVVPGGNPIPRQYPDPALDPGARAPARPVARPAPAPADVPSVTDVPLPVEPGQVNPSEPGGSAIPPGAVSTTPGQ